MMQRRDALAGAAEWMTVIESYTRLQGGNLVAIVGILHAAPGAVNVISGEVTLSLDIRGPQDESPDRLADDLLARARQIARHRDLQFHATEFYRIPAPPVIPLCSRF